MRGSDHIFFSPPVLEQKKGKVIKFRMITQTHKQGRKPPSRKELHLIFRYVGMYIFYGFTLKTKAKFTGVVVTHDFNSSTQEADTGDL